MVTRQHRTSVLDIRVMSGADVKYDHKLVRCKVIIKLRKPRKMNEKKRKKFDINELRQPNVSTAFKLSLRNKFGLLQNEDITDGNNDIAYKRHQIETS